MFDTPVLYLVFNRPELTRKTFEAIKKTRPGQLFIAADGPRVNYPSDPENCEEVRRIVAEVDWDCQLKTLFRKENLGCAKGVSEGIDWFFSQVEEGIILEDDILPAPGFFTFCNDMLKKYRDREDVMHIGGINFDFFNRTRNRDCYFFSGLAHIWGWATWKRAWRFFDLNMQGFPEKIGKIEIDPVFRDLFEKTYRKEIDTWDYQWKYAVMSNRGKCIVPARNMITNLGFVSSAVHTARIPEWMEFMKTHPYRAEKEEKEPAFQEAYEKIVIKNTIESRYSLPERIYLKYLHAKKIFKG